MENTATIRVTRNQLILHTSRLRTCQKKSVVAMHHAAFDFDNGFSVTSLKSGKDFDLKQEVEIGPRKKKR